MSLDISFSRTDTFTPSGATGIVYRQLGSGDPLFAFHGGSGSYRHWIRNLEFLGGHFTVTAPDLPGFGDSGDVPADISLEDYVSRVAAFVEAQLPRGERFHMAGFSYGGMIGSGVAARLKDRVRALTLIGPGGMGNPLGNRPGIKLLKARPGMAEEEIMSIHRTNVTTMMIRDEAKVTEETVRLHRANIERARFRNWGLSWTNSVPGFLAELNCPMQLILGEFDPMARPTVQDRIDRCKAANPRLLSHIIPGAGHWVAYEEPDIINDLLLRLHQPAP